MRKHLIIFTFMIGAIALIATDCKKEEETDECSAFEMPSINRNFVIWAHFTLEDGTPYTDDVSFNIRKTYCDGHVSGDYYIHHIDPDEFGDWFSGMTYNYDLANQKDKITINFTVHNPWLNQADVIQEELFYDDVVSLPDLLHFDISLPWSSQP